MRVVTIHTVLDRIEIMQEKLIHMVSTQKDLTVFTFSWDIYIYENKRI